MPSGGKSTSEESHGGADPSKELRHRRCRAAIDKFQQKWVNSTDELVSGTADQDILTHCRHLREKYRPQLDAWLQNSK